jgi:hypothetical protein
VRIELFAIHAEANAPQLGQREAEFVDLGVSQRNGLAGLFSALGILLDAGKQLGGERTQLIRGHGGQEIQRRLEDHVDLAALDDVDCPLCEGGGRWQGEDCPACSGNGHMPEHVAERGDLRAYNEVDCPVCEGSGRDENSDDCRACAGEGAGDAGRR